MEMEGKKSKERWGEKNLSKSAENVRRRGRRAHGAEEKGRSKSASMKRNPRTAAALAGSAAPAKEVPEREGAIEEGRISGKRKKKTRDAQPAGTSNPLSRGNNGRKSKEKTQPTGKNHEGKVRTLTRRRGTALRRIRRNRILTLGNRQGVGKDGKARGFRGRRTKTPYANVDGDDSSHGGQSQKSFGLTRRENWDSPDKEKDQ